MIKKDIMFLSLICTAMILIFFVLIVIEKTEGQKIGEEAVQGKNWKWNVGRTCNFNGTAYITTNPIITENILIYTAVIQAGSCFLTTDIRYIMNVNVSSNETQFDALIQNDLDAWADEAGTVSISDFNAQTRKALNKGNSTRGSL